MSFICLDILLILQYFSTEVIQYARPVPYYLPVGLLST